MDILRSIRNARTARRKYKRDLTVVNIYGGFATPNYRSTLYKSEVDLQRGKHGFFKIILISM